MSRALPTLPALPVFPALLALLGAAGAVSAVAEPVRYTLDPERSFVHFEVKHFGTSTLRGRFGPAQGTVTLDRAAGSGEVGVRVPAASVDTGVAPLNSRLRQGDLLAVDSNPEVFFVARNLRFAGDRLVELRGEFTLRGTSQPLSLRALHFACRDDAERQREVCGGDFEAFFNRSDFGLSFSLPFVADRVRLLVQVEGVRQ